MTRHNTHNTRSVRLNRFESLESRLMLSAPGTLDNTFDGDGKATPTAVFSGSFNARDMALQTDGKTVVAGTYTDSGGNSYGAIVRLLFDGQRDPAFNGGVPVLAFVPSGFDTEIHAMALASDGKIVVVGQSTVGNILFPEPEMLVMRFNSDGTIDNSFSDDGRVLFDLGDGFSTTAGFDVAIQPDGMIVVVGTAYKIPDWDFVVIRLSANGSLDRRLVEPLSGIVLNPGFASDGVAHVGFGGNDEARAAKLDSAGNIYVAGNVNFATDQLFVGLMKMSSLGGLVSSFDNDGKANFGVPGRSITLMEDLLLQGDKMVIVGHARSPSGQFDFFVARFTATGVLDTTFGENNQGFTVTDLGGNDIVEGIVAAPFGTGGGFIVSGSSGGMAAVKYTDNGLLDTSFGSGGKVKLGFGGAANIAPGPGRRVTLAGGPDFATARLLLNGGKGVSAGALDSVAIEGTTNTAKLFVARTERLPVPTRVFLGVSGTTSLSSTRAGTRDYTIPGLVLTPITTTSGSAYVDIPANETLVQLTLTPVNDSIAEPSESANFTILANSNYEIGSPGAGSITIQDDDTVNNSVGVSTVAAPPKHVDVDEELQAAVTWTVPSGGWRQLSSIQLRLRNIHNDDALALLTFDEATNSFSVESTLAGDNPVSLVLSKCRIEAAGPSAPTVKVIFTFFFNEAAANERFAVDVAARNDGDDFSGFMQIGELHVHKKHKGGGTASFQVRWQDRLNPSLADAFYEEREDQK